MNKELFNGWIDGSVEPKDGCEAKVVYLDPSHINKKEIEDLAHYNRGSDNWKGFTGDIAPIYVIRYCPIPPHDKIATTGSSVLEVGDE